MTGNICSGVQSPLHRAYGILAPKPGGVREKTLGMKMPLRLVWVWVFL